MDSISQEEFDKAIELVPERNKEEKVITEQEFETMLRDMQSPVHAQKQLAVQIKIFLDKRIKDEMMKNGYLGENTRKWIETYNNILEKLQKALHGDKTLNLHVHDITHGDIAAKMREAVVIVDEQKKKKKESE